MYSLYPSNCILPVGQVKNLPGAYYGEAQYSEDNGYLCSLPSHHVRAQSFVASSTAHQLKPPV